VSPLSLLLELVVKTDWVALLNEILIDKTASRTFNGIDNPECILRIERKRETIDE